MKKIVDSFIIGGTKAGPSLPGPRLQGMIGGEIEVDYFAQRLRVPTPDGLKVAERGDRIVLYDDNTLEVEKCR